MGSIPLDGEVQVGGVRPPPAAAVDAAPPKPPMKQKQKRRPSGSPQKQRAAEQKQRKSSTEGVPLTRDTTGTVSASSTDASSGSKSPKGDPHDA